MSAELGTSEVERARRRAAAELERRKPLFMRLCSSPPHKAPALDRADGTAGLAGRDSPASVADRLPFFLRAWWLREDAGSGFASMPSGLYTMPVGSPYSDPLCDVACADVRLA